MRNCCCMKYFKKQSKIELIHHAEFVAWVLNPTDESNRYWEAYLTENPDMKKEFNQTRFLIKGLVPNEKSLSETEVELLWEKIEQSNISKKRNHFKIRRWSVAAGFLLVIGLSGWFLSTHNKSENSLINYHSIVVPSTSGNEIKLIYADHTEKTFTSKEVGLKYDQDGKLETKTGKQVQTEEVLGQNRTEEQMNQIVVPRGRRSNIELADGTKLWLNSGSRAIYPVVFKGKSREIFIEGEGYLEVAHDATKPFYVVTDNMKVKVLGTKFNVSAYKEDDHVSLVLVEGSIEATTSHKSLLLKPNQLLNYTKLTDTSTIEQANVFEYVSWVDGWMLCNKEKLQSIVIKLSRYYDIKICYHDLRLNNLTLTGKLDLKNNCEDVFKVICATAPLNYQINDKGIFLTIKE